MIFTAAPDARSQTEPAKKADPFSYWIEVVQQGDSDYQKKLASEAAKSGQTHVPLWPVPAGTPHAAATTVRLDEGGSLTLLVFSKRYRDGKLPIGVIHLESGAEAVIDPGALSRKGGTAKALVKATKGTILLEKRKGAADKTTFRLESPVATMAIRGTAIGAHLANEGKDLLATVYEGVAEITPANPMQASDAQTLSAGSFVRVQTADTLVPWQPRDRETEETRNFLSTDFPEIARKGNWMSGFDFLPTTRDWMIDDFEAEANPVTKRPSSNKFALRDSETIPGPGPDGAAGKVNHFWADTESAEFRFPPVVLESFSHFSFRIKLRVAEAPIRGSSFRKPWDHLSVHFHNSVHWKTGDDGKRSGSEECVRKLLSPELISHLTTEKWIRFSLPFTALSRSPAELFADDRARKLKIELKVDGEEIDYGELSGPAFQIDDLQLHREKPAWAP